MAMSKEVCERVVSLLSEPQINRDSPDLLIHFPEKHELSVVIMIC